MGVVSSKLHTTDADAILVLENILVMFDLLYLILGGFNECGLVVDDVFQHVDKLPHLPGGDLAGAF